MKVWISKYALSRCIKEEMDARILDDKMIHVEGPYGGQYYHSGEWHKSKEAAVAKAKEMVQNKRKSIAKQLKKLDELEASLK